MLVLLDLLVAGAHAFDADQVGLAPLRREQPALTGSNVFVGQSEAGDGSADHWEVNPSSVGQPVSLFTWISAAGTATDFPNAVGLSSGHASAVGWVFYGSPGGMAPGVAQVRSYEANHYINSVILSGAASPDMIVNQSWIAGQDSLLEQIYDDYAASHNVLFVSGVNNDTATPPAPASAYNGLAVGSHPGGSSVGPTSDGRAKPDLVFPNGATSYCAPVVAGAAALLWQAAARDDGGSNTAAQATNSSVIKALLLNGAMKPAGWTNGTTRPLDARFGAGIANVYTSWRQLSGGRARFIETNYVAVGGPHPPAGNPTNVSTLRGWDLNSVRSTSSSDGVAHYYFSLPAKGGAFTATATLVWKKPELPAPLKNLDLFLYEVATSNLVRASTSAVDNVEHLFVTNLPPGRYDLQVLKRGAPGMATTESYSLAFDFAAARLSLARSNGAVVLSWPVHPASLILQTATSLNPAILWQDVAAPPFITNGMNTVLFGATNALRAFRLRRP